MSRPAKSVGRHILSGLVSLAIGLGLLFIVGPDAMYARASKNWPQTQGTVESFEIIDKSDSDSNSYLLKVHYVYAVDEQQHRADRVAFGGNSSSSRSQQEQRAQQYLPGTEVTVYYDPANPGRAVLEPGFHFAAMWPLGLSAFMLVMGLLSGLRAVRAGFSGPT